MAKYTDPVALLRDQERLFPLVQRRARRMHLVMVGEIEGRVRSQLLSGTNTPQDLRRAGHPYGFRTSHQGFKRESLKGGWRLSSRGDRKRTRHITRNVGIAFPLLPINAPTKTLQKSAAIVRTSLPDGGQKVQLAYRAPYAKYILSKKGTSKMKGRGFQAAKGQIDRKAERELRYRLRYLDLTAAASGTV
jgi:hypothetical protein